MFLDPYQNKGGGWYRETSFSPSVIILLTVPRRCFLFCFFVICVYLCHTVMSVSCSLVVRKVLTSWLSCMCWFLVFLSLFPIGVLGQVWYLIVSITDFYLLPYYPGIQFRLPCTPPPPPPRTIFHGCQIVHWDPLDAKQRCPQNNFGLGYVILHGFYGNPQQI